MRMAGWLPGSGVMENCLDVDAGRGAEDEVCGVGAGGGVADGVEDEGFGVAGVGGGVGGLADGCG